MATNRDWRHLLISPEITLQRDKLKFAEQFAERQRSGNLSPARDGRGEAGVESRSDGTPANHKINQNPERSERVAEAIATH